MIGKTATLLQIVVYALVAGTTWGITDFILERISAHRNKGEKS